MTVYLEVAQALVAARYLSNTDVDAAAAVLVNTMRIAGVKHQEIMAIDDLVAQEGVITEAQAEAAAAAEEGDYAGQAHQASIIEQAEKAEIQDRGIIAAADEAIGSATLDAAEALVAAGLVDAAYADGVVEVIRHARW